MIAICRTISDVMTVTGDTLQVSTKDLMSDLGMLEQMIAIDIELTDE